MNVTIYPDRTSGGQPFHNIRTIWLVNEESYGDLDKLAPEVAEEGGLLINPANVVAIVVSAD